MSFNTPNSIDNININNHYDNYNHHRLGLLQVAVTNTAMSSVIKATTSFVVEKLIIQRERRNNSYSVLPYFLAKLLAEVPLSALFPCISGA